MAGSQGLGSNLCFLLPEHEAAEPGSPLSLGILCDCCVFMPVACTPRRKFFESKALYSPVSSAERN